MAEPLVFPSQDGQEVQVTDVQNVGAVAGLADDRVLAELLRLTPYDGTNVYRGIVPFGYRVPLGGANPGSTVQSSGSANGSIVVNPFRAIVGSRNAVGTAPMSPNPAGSFQPPSLANWRDIRSGIFVGSAVGLTQTIALTANSSGNPRWDLVYATITVDANGPSATRRIKNPSTSVVSAVALPAWLQSPVTVAVVTGTPGASPALPAIPADGGGAYNIPIAYVYVQNGFSSSTTINAKQIRTYANATSTFVHPAGVAVVPATGNNDRAATYAANFGWGTTASRPPVVISPDCVGGFRLIAQIDAQTAGAFSHPLDSIIDNQYDWRNRYFRVDVQWDNAGSPRGFSSDTAGGVSGTQYLPTGGQGTVLTSGGGTPISFPTQLTTTIPLTSLASSFGAGNDFGLPSGTGGGAPGSGNPMLFAMQDAQTATKHIGAYIKASDGTLRFTAVGSTTYGRIFIWVEASAQFPNYQ